MIRRRGAASSFATPTVTKSYKGKKCRRCGKTWQAHKRPTNVDAKGNYWCRDCKYYMPEEEQ